MMATMTVYDGIVNELDGAQAHVRCLCNCRGKVEDESRIWRCEDVDVDMMMVLRMFGDGFDNVRGVGMSC